MSVLSNFPSNNQDSDVFIAVYGTTTSAEIEAAYQAGKEVLARVGMLTLRLSSRINASTHIFCGTGQDGSQVSKGCANDIWQDTSLGYKPANHASEHSTTGSDPITPKSIGAAAKPNKIYLELLASNWDSTSKTQTVAANGVLSDESKQLIIITPSLASQATYYDSIIKCTNQSLNSLTFTAGTIPTSNLYVYVVIQEVE